MTIEVIWSDDAVSDYYQNIDYLLKEWSEKVATEFIEDVDITIDLIKINPELYPLTNHLEVRKAVIRKQVTLFYKVSNQNIYLLRFWNTYQNPKDLNL
jgi:plasmid stabilization system protein ParE